MLTRQYHLKPRTKLLRPRPRHQVISYKKLSASTVSRQDTVSSLKYHRWTDRRGSAGTQCTVRYRNVHGGPYLGFSFSQFSAACALLMLNPVSLVLELQNIVYWSPWPGKSSVTNVLPYVLAYNSKNLGQILAQKKPGVDLYAGQHLVK